MIALEPSLSASSAGSIEAQTVPCSLAQQRFWFEEQLHPGNPGLNVAVRWQLEGQLTQDVLVEAWQRLAARHAALRSSFAAVDGAPVGLVRWAIAFPVGSVDLRALVPNERTLEADRLADVEAHTTFDLAVAPLMRVKRIVLTDNVSILLVTAHHVICDGWSVGILAHEMGVICSALAAGREPILPVLPIDYSDYAAWEGERAQAGLAATQTASAEKYLRGYTQFELLPDYARPPLQTSNGNITSVLIAREITDALAELARTNGCTLFVAALAGLFALLNRYSQDADITLGTQVAGREDEDLEGIVGCFINTIALRGDLSADPSFARLLERTRTTVSDAFELRDVPLERLIEAVKPKRDLSRNTLFSVNFIFQRSFIKNAVYGDFKLVDLPSRSSGALYDLNIFMVERPDGWRASCEYNTDLFARATIDGMLEHFVNLLRAVVADPQQRISEIPVLSTAERQALIGGANLTQHEYPQNETLPELFAAQGARTPDAPALTCGSTSMTYAELDAASNRLARELKQRGIACGMRVGVLLDRSPNLVVALLAVMKSGAAYVPLDPTFPVDRLAYIAANAQLAAVITRQPFRGRVPDQTACIDLDIDRAHVDARASGPLTEPPAPADIAYVIYTSGSTGMPKGVAVGHRALVNLLWAMRERPGVTASDTLVAVTTISFDIAALEIFLPLVVGARVVLASERDVVDGTALLELVRSSHATILQATPVSWQLLIDAGWRGDPPLKMLCGGEALPRALADQLLERGPELWNMYGPTETTIWSSAIRVERGTQPPRIGPPIANTQFYVLDPHGNPVPPGVPGELYIGGDGVAFGYFNRPALTLERFVPDPFSPDADSKLYRTGDVVRSRDSGTFEFLGRTDHQVKLRGFRIELGEIEAALERQPGVAESVVSIQADPAGSASICAYVVPRPGTAPDPTWPATLRTTLATFLPAYMLPATIVPLDALPRTPNGKIDRHALPMPYIASVEGAVSDADSPQSATEIALAELVAALLGRARIGRNEDLFALGFHSLLAVKLVAQIRRKLGVKLPLRAFFSYSTVAALAEQIGEKSELTSLPLQARPIVRLNAEGTRPPFLFFHNDMWSGGTYTRRIALTVGPEQPILAIAPHGTAGLPALPTIEAMAADYLTRLRREQPAGPYRLGGICAGALVAYELARMLRACGETVELLVVVNAAAPARRCVLFGDALLRRIGLDSHLDLLVREILCSNIAGLFDAIGSGPMTTLRFLTNVVKKLPRNGFERTAGDRLNRFDATDTPGDAAQIENFAINSVAAATYHPQPYDGELTFVRGAARPVLVDPTAGWGRLAQGVRVVPLAGGYPAPLRTSLDDLGHVLGTLLRPNHRKEEDLNVDASL